MRRSRKIESVVVNRKKKEKKKSENGMSYAVENAKNMKSNGHANAKT